MAWTGWNWIFAGGLIVCAASPAVAAQLHVEPVLVELNAPASAGTLTIRNEEDVEATVQIRVFRWFQTDGREILEPTSDVVASPPAVKLVPRQDYVVRVVRVGKQPVSGEESYRVIVDRLPNPQVRQARSVNLLIRQSIPAFFRARQLSAQRVSWAIRDIEGKPFLIARNDGDERLRLSSLRIQEASGRTVSFGRGLLGYALGRSTMMWPIPAPRGFGGAGAVTIHAESDKGPVHAVVPASPLR